MDTTSGGGCIGRLNEPYPKSSAVDNIKYENTSRDGGVVPRKAHNLQARVQFPLPQQKRGTIILE